MKLHSLKYFLFIFIFSFCTSILKGQNVSYVPLHTNATIDNLTINTTLATGSTLGQSSAMNGAAGYSIPLAMPMGTGGVVPEISINYSSMGGQSALGYGWGLSGMSSITRTGQNTFYDGVTTPIQYNGADRFSLDGSRLLILSGTYGVSGSIYGFESENFTRITAFGGTTGDPSYFVMETKEGIKFEYGKDNDSRYENNSGKAMTWNLSKMIYPDGNYISYKYKNVHNWPGGGVWYEHSLDEINFTGNDLAGLMPYSTVKFYYLERTDDIIGYQNGTMINKGLLVASIQISTDGMSVKNYDLTYGYRKGNTFLHEIKEKGADGSALNATRFKYGDEASGNNTQLVNQPIFMDDDYFPSNLNGDGNTDLLFARRNAANPGEHLFFEGTSNISFNVPLTTTSRVVSVADFNGDNLDDVVDLSFYPEEYNGTYYSSFRLRAHYNSDPNGLLDYNENYTINPPTSNPFEREHVNNDHISPIHTGDFNGDGLADIFYVNGERLLICYGQRSITQPLSPWQFVTLNLNNPNTLNWLWGFDIEKLAIMDFNGDGKSDILVINGAQSAVFEFETNTQLKEIFFNNSGSVSITNRLFDQEFLTFYGDFNSDGRIDVLVKTGDENSDPWFINYSTGVGFNRVSFDFVRNPSIEQQDFDVYHGDIVSVGDYNGDGKSDILLIGKESLNTSYTDVYYSSGYSFSSPVYESHPGVSHVTGFTGPTYYGIDGRARTMYRAYTNFPALEIRQGFKSKENLLMKVRNGELHTTLFDYQLMSDKIDLNDDFYLRGPISNASFTISNIQLPQWLVRNYNVQDGRAPINGMYPDNTLKVQNIKYEHTLLHRTGKGILGFGKVCVDDKWSYLRALTYSSANATYGIMLPDSVVTEFVTGNDFTKSESQHSVTSVTTGRYLKRPSKMVMNNFFENRKTVTDFLTYDAWANPTLTQTQIFENNTLLQTSTITSLYGAFGSSTPDKPTSVTQDVFRSGEASYINNSNFEYSALGQVSLKREFVGQAKQVESSYEYYAHGGLYKATKTATGLDPQTIYTYYDPKGRYVNEKKNIFGNTVYNASYDVRWGKPLSTTDEAGLITGYTYDVWGRTESMTSPTGIVSNQQYQWESTDGIRSETFTSPSKPTTKIWYDQMGRTRKNQTNGFNGNLITSTTTYDLVGNPYQNTAPYKTGEAILTTTNQYGAAFTAQRLMNTSTNVAAFGTKNYDYTYNQGHEIVTETSPDGKTSTRVIGGDGLVIQTIDNNNTTLDFKYYSHGGVREVKQGANVLVTVEYDAYNRKKKQTDISAGVSEYEYDAFGRLVSETNAKGQVTTMTYDRFDRLVTMIRPEGTTSYEYWSPGNTGKSYKLKKVIGYSGDIEEMDYDASGRLVSQTMTIDGQAYPTTILYDVLDRVQSKTYPSGLTLQYEYDAYSHLKKIYSGSTDYLVVDEVNGRGQITKYTSGNGKQSIHDYFHGIPTRYRTSDGAFDYQMEWNYQNGNLKKRYDQDGNKDTMSYDILDRLYTYTTTNLISYTKRDTVFYQDNGNIQKKTDVGIYSYDPVRIHAISEVTNPAGVIRDPEQDITYNSFLQPTVIEEANFRLEYTYGYHGNRIKSVLKQDGQVIETKYYLGEYEKLVNGTGTHFIQYIDIGGQLIAIIDSEGGNHTPHYTYSDHLGSIVMVTDAAGNIEAKQNFDPWGRRRDGYTWEYINENLPLNLPLWLYRGYTGHEHLPQFHLVNMNGRLYDPELGRMLSPDNLIQDGGYSQNYNRYSYVYNNPLKYTDPDGNEVISLILSVAVSVISNGIDNSINGKPFFQGADKAFTIGLFGGVFAIGIGDIAGTIGNVYLRAAFQAGAHGYFGGVFSEAQGGTFRNGFTSGAVSSLASSGAQALKLGPAGIIIVGGVSGGLSALIGGGNFWQGLRQGIIVGALNHVGHMAAEGGGPDDGLWDFKDQLTKWKADVRAGKIASAESINAYITPLESFVLTTTGRTIVTAADIADYEGMIGTAMLTMVPVGRALSWVFRAKGSFVVYQGFENGVVKYIGITKRAPGVRWAEHRAAGGAKALLDFRVANGAKGLSQTQARIWEQNLINQHGLNNLYNIRNSIAFKNWGAFGIKP